MKDIGNSREGVVGLETVVISDEKLLRMMKMERHRKEKPMILTKAGDFVCETRLFSEPDKLVIIDDGVRRIEDVME